MISLIIYRNFTDFYVLNKIFTCKFKLILFVLDTSLIVVVYIQEFDFHDEADYILYD